MDASKQGYNYTTMRSLLALIRLCQARVFIHNHVGKTQIFNRGLEIRHQ